MHRHPRHSKDETRHPPYAPPSIRQVPSDEKEREEYSKDNEDAKVRAGEDGRVRGEGGRGPGVGGEGVEPDDLRRRGVSSVWMDEGGRQGGRETYLVSYDPEPAQLQQKPQEETAVVRA